MTTAGPQGEAGQEPLALLKALLSAVRARSLYPLRHPTVEAGVRDLVAALAALHAKAPETVVAVVGRELLVDGRPLVQDSPVFERFRDDLTARGVEKLTVRRGVRREDLEALVESFCTSPENLEARGGMDRHLFERGVRGVIVGKLKTDEDEDVPGGHAQARATYRKGVEGVEQISEKFRSGRAVSAAEVREIASLLIQGLRGQRSPMLAALALRQKSAYTFTHSLNVSLLVLAQVEMLELTDKQLEDLTAAGLLHDVGKLFIPDEILNKTGPLTDVEWQVIRRHPVYALETLRRMRGVSDLVLIAAFEHHLRFDGSGYPARRAPWPQSHVTYLTALADCYDAMRTTRSYDPEWPCEKVYATMTGLGGKAFHPRLLDRFFRIIGMYPPGTVVRLSDGATGKVTKNHPAWHDRPTVQVTWTPAAGTVEKPFLVDLALERELRGEEGVRITESIRHEAGAA